MDITTVRIIIVGIIIFGLAGLALNQIEIASVALGAISGFLSKEAITERIDEDEAIVEDD